MMVYCGILLSLLLICVSGATRFHLGSFFSRHKTRSSSAIDAIRGGDTPQRVATQVVVAAYTNENAADNAAETLKAGMLAGVLYYRNVAIVKKNQDGKVICREVGQIPLGDFCAAGAFVGGALAVLLGPLGAAAGAATGAALGARAGSDQKAIDNDKMDEIYYTGVSMLKEGTSAIVVVMDDVQVNKKDLREITPERDSLIYQLAHDVRNNLEKGQDSAYLFALTEDGVATTRVVIGEDAVDLKSLIASKEGVVVGEATVDADKEVTYEAAAVTEDNMAYTKGHTEDGKVVVDEQKEKEL